MMGGPAAGKSTVRKARFAEMAVVDCDIIKAGHPDYDPKNPSALHAWSSAAATRQFYAALASGTDVVFDGTGSTAEKYVKFIQDAQAAGYETEVCYVTVSLKTAIARNAARERSVPVEVVREKHSLIATSFDIVSRFADRVTVVRTE